MELGTEEFRLSQFYLPFFQMKWMTVKRWDTGHYMFCKKTDYLYNRYYEHDFFERENEGTT